MFNRYLSNRELHSFIVLIFIAQEIRALQGPECKVDIMYDRLTKSQNGYTIDLFEYTTDFCIKSIRLRNSQHIEGSGN